MTQVHIQGFGGGFGSGGGFWGSVKRLVAMLAAFMVGALVLIAASVVAVATAIIGVIIAFVAMLMRVGAFRGRARTAQPKQNANDDGDGVILEAHRTARGWTVED